MASKNENIAYLEARDIPLPDFVKDLNEDQVAALRQFVEAVLNTETEALEKMFELGGKLAKFIPGFVRNKMVPAFIAPPLVAKVAETMTPKEAVGVSGGLPDQYISESFLFMAPHKASALLAEFKQQRGQKIFELMVRNKPALALLVAHECNDRVLRSITSRSAAATLREAAAGQEAMLSRLQNL